MRGLRACCAWFGLGVAAIAATADPRAESFSFDLPAGKAERTLKQLAEQTGVEVVFSTTLAAGVQTRAVRGTYTAIAAAQRMLDGTSLHANRDGSVGAIIVSRREPPRAAAGPPAGGAPEGPKKKPAEDAAKPSPESTMKSRNLLTALAALFAAGTASTGAQTIAGAKPPVPDEAIVLSPFEVEATEATGYQARSTLAGTRIRTSLEDVAASIQVVTKEFLQDTNSARIDELLVYTTGTEVAGPGGNFSSGFVQFQGIQTSFNSQWNANRQTRVRGLEAADQTRNFFETNIPFHAYNTDRVEINRGANATLFGLGSPAGIINQATLVPLFRNKARVSLDVDDHGSLTGTLDLERMLLKNQLSVRVATLVQRERFQQKEAYEDQDRGYLSATYQPRWGRRQGGALSGLTLHVNYEKGREKAQRPEWGLPNDAGLAYYFALGKPRWDPRFDDLRAADRNIINSNIPQAGAVIYMDPGSAVPGVPNVNGTTVYWMQGFANPNVHANVPNGNTQIFQILTRPQDKGSLFGRFGGNPFDNADQIVDERVFPYRDHLFTNGLPGQKFEFETTQVYLESRFFDDTLALRLSATDEVTTEVRSDLSLGSASGEVTVDINTHQVTGEVNPNYGRPYATFRGFTRFDKRKSRNARADLFYKLDLERFNRGRLGRMLGVHDFSASYTERVANQRNQAGRGFVAGDDIARLSQTQLQNATDISNGDIRIVSYIGPSLVNVGSLSDVRLAPVTASRDPSSITAANGSFLYWNPAGNRWDNTFIPVVHNRTDNGIPYSQGLGVNRSEYESSVFVWQAQMLQRLFVPTVSWRKDKVVDYTIDTAARLRDPVRSHFLTDPQYYKLGTKPTSTFEADTFSYGGVLKAPRRWLESIRGVSGLSVFYNESENFRPTGTRVNVYGEGVPPQTGLNKEYGFQLNLFGDKMSVRTTFYETSQANISQGSSSVQVVQNLINAWQGPLNYLRANGGTALAANLQSVSPGITQAQVNAQVAALRGNAYPHQQLHGWFTLPNGDLSFVLPTGIAVTNDRISEGIEVEVIYNPTRNWRMALNIARQEAINANSGSDLERLIGELRPLLERWSGLPNSTAGTGSVADLVASNIEAPFQRIKLLDRTSSPELREWRINLVSNYRFSNDSRLKNWNVGGALRWQDKATIGYATTFDPVSRNYLLDPSRPFFGPSETRVDAWVGYKRKILRDRFLWGVQLNVRNVLDKDDLIPLRADPNTGAGEVFYFASPREFTLSTSIEF
jgi:outer membrane receptor protein involved in Fe transport